ncbi:MAG: cytochrome b N-terminal domain-containing protein, partial [Candidatus Omnitrophica bacterium]|nr:cytochrome b N-terminal domain-containing protein [Candidatus Omnitrophota bacterium]
DQLAIWAVTVGTNMAANTPLLGAEGPFAIVTPENDARFLLLGSKLVGQSGLLRFYVLHCVFLPLAFVILVSVHFWRVRKDEFSAVPLPPQEERKKGVEEWLKGHPEALQEKVFTWPNLVSREFVAALALTLVLVVWSIFGHAPLEELANPNKTPNPSKAPWYFVGLQELLVYFDPWIAGVVLPTLILIGLMVLPYVDSNPRGVGYYNFRDRKFSTGIFTYGLGLWFALIVIGYYLRGPGWEIFMPWEPWDHFRASSQVALKNMPNPVGIGFLLAYAAAGMLLPALLFKKFTKAMGPVRYGIVMFFVLAMFFVPVKILLRNVFMIKYIISFPNVNLNI